MCDDTGSLGAWGHKSGLVCETLFLLLLRDILSLQSLRGVLLEILFLFSHSGTGMGNGVKLHRRPLRLFGGGLRFKHTAMIPPCALFFRDYRWE